jgi:MFS family permease
LPVLSLTSSDVFFEWAVVVLGFLLFYSIDFVVITSTMVMINNAVWPNERGKLNGLSMAAGNLARGASPPLFGAIFAATAKKENVYPFNYACAFNVIAGLVLISYLFSRKVTSSLDVPKTGNRPPPESIRIELEEKILTP